MATRPYIALRPAVQITLSGADRDPKLVRKLSLRDVLSFQTTNIVTPGSAKCKVNFAHRPGDNWPWDYRAMDRLSISGGVRGDQPGAPMYPMWTGLLDNPQADISVETGESFPFEASTMYKRFEVVTEGDYQSGNTQWSTMLVMQGSLYGWQVVKIAAQAVGFSLYDQDIDETSPDYHSIQAPLVAFDASTYPGLNHQYQQWSSIISNSAQFVGREVFTDESGKLHYRKSHYENDPIGTIRKEWIIHPTVSIDTDAALVNEVRVRYGLVENEQTVGVANAPVGYPLDHYGLRQLTIAAPWLQALGDANWYAAWVLSWALHNTRPGVVQLAFAPDIVCGEVYVLPWPQPTAYYVMSVVHNYQVGKPMTTTLGLSYGRPLGTKWFDVPAPSNFGANLGTGGVSPSGAATLGNLNGYQTGSRWRITHYTRAGLNEYVDPSGQSYLVGKFGYRLYKDSYTRQDSDTAIKRTYTPFRECAISGPTTANPLGQKVGDYVIPELSGQKLAGPNPSTGAPDLTSQVHLSAGDLLMLLPSRIIVEVGDQIGTDAPVADLAGNVTYGRQLDVFYWDESEFPDTPDYQDVAYLYVKEAGMQPPAFYNSSAPATINSVTGIPTWADGGAVALFADAQESILRLDSSNRNRVGPAGSTIGTYARNSYQTIPPTQDPSNEVNLPGDVQCVVFVRFCYLYGGRVALPGISYAAQALSGWAGDGGMVNVNGYLPQPGDVLVFDDVSDGSGQSSTDVGHVAIIDAVNAPQNNQAGSVHVAQSNCVSNAQGAPIVSTFPLVNRGGGYYIIDNYPNTFGKTVSGLLRWAGK